jgi:hypothetical protein
MAKDTPQHCSLTCSKEAHANNARPNKSIYNSGLLGYEVKFEIEMNGSPMFMHPANQNSNERHKNTFETPVILLRIETTRVAPQLCTAATKEIHKQMM